MNRHELTANIRKLVRYLSDDRYIASYLGVPVERVSAERRKLPKVIVKGEVLRAPALMLGTADTQAADRAATIALGKACVAYMVRHHPNSDVARMAA